MNSLAVAALMLALAIAVLPSTPRHRLTALTATPARHRMAPWPASWAGGAVGCIAAAGAVLLPLPTFVTGAALGATASLRYRRGRRSRRSRDESRQLATALDVLISELHVGAHPVRAFIAAADETAGTISASCRAVAARAKLGADVTAGLQAVALSSTLPVQWDRVAACWQLACDHGLAMAALMRSAQRDIAERQRFLLRVTAATAGARTTATILAGLPALGVLLGQLIGAHPLHFLLNGQAGGWFLAAGVTLACGGLLWSDHIVDRLLT